MNDSLQFVSHLIVNGADGSGGASYKKLPRFMELLKKVVSADGDFSLGFLPNVPFLGAVVRVLGLVLTKEIHLSPEDALVLLAFPKQMRRTVRELLDEIENLCKTYGTPRIDEYSLNFILVQLEEHGVVMRVSDMEFTWELNEKFDINPF